MHYLCNVVNTVSDFDLFFSSVCSFADDMLWIALTWFLIAVSVFFSSSMWITCHDHSLNPLIYHGILLVDSALFVLVV